MNFRIFEKLSRLYRDPRLISYQRAFYKASLEQPYLPSIIHILATFLGQTVKQNLKTWSSTSLSQGRHFLFIHVYSFFVSVCLSFNLVLLILDLFYFPVSELGIPKNLPLAEQCPSGQKSSVPKLLKQIFSALKIYPSEKITKNEESEKSVTRSDLEKYSSDSRSALLNLGNYILLNFAFVHELFSFEFSKRDNRIHQFHRLYNIKEEEETGKSKIRNLDWSLLVMSYQNHCMELSSYIVLRFCIWSFYLRTI